ncbi:hypothetical protein EDF62_3441 [Leucobacter luti]|uniref:Oxygen-dependent protoporphyrinogen oxidase n=1 Tax=Leucobacter luti TaxID=340320 RepID=A0A4R6RQW1_9MICO|nr:hypothetical protein [Leucobacter luti]TDP89120.1 hypothetical protein EDF62_3441 [Leucobacter luti]
MVDVVVLGDSLPELASALELAEVGLSVRIYPHMREDDRADPRDADGVRDPDGSLRSFLAHVATPIGGAGAPENGSSPGFTELPPPPPLLQNAQGEWLPQPQPAVFGIPAVPLSSASLALLGGGAAFRAALDRIRPVLTIGKTHEFGELVRNRMGGGVLERLVEPLTREAYGVPAADVDVAIIAPGLNEALTRMGSLSGAALDYAERNVARETRVAPSAGWGELRTALLRRLGLYAVEFVESPAGIVTATETGWTVATGAAAASGSLHPEESGPQPTAGVQTPEQATTARAIVRGAAASGHAPQDPELSGLLGGPRRICGRVAVAQPAFPSTHPEGPGVRGVQVGDGSSWTVRFAPAGAGWQAIVSGPAAQGLATTEAARSAAEAWVKDAAIAAGATLIEGTAEVSMPFAPYVTIEQRDAAQGQLSAWADARPGQIPTGGALHGGDLAAAIADARARAIQLRRHLTGITD